MSEDLRKVLGDEWETLKNMIAGEKIPFPRNEVEQAYNDGIMRAIVMVRQRHVQCFGCAPLPDWLKEEDIPK